MIFCACSLSEVLWPQGFSSYSGPRAGGQALDRHGIVMYCTSLGEWGLGFESSRVWGTMAQSDIWSHDSVVNAVEWTKRWRLAVAIGEVSCSVMLLFYCAVLDSGASVSTASLVLFLALQGAVDPQ